MDIWSYTLGYTHVYFQSWKFKLECFTLEIPLWTEESVRPPLPIDSDALFVGGPEAGDELHVQVKWFVPVQGTQHLTRLQRS